MALIDVEETLGTISQIDESELVRSEGQFENSSEVTIWVEYRRIGAPADSRPIHRSVHVTLKQGVISDTVVQGF
jgi:hypothetical protein